MSSLQIIVYHSRDRREVFHILGVNVLACKRYGTAHIIKTAFLLPSDYRRSHYSDRTKSGVPDSFLWFRHHLG
ncbi:MAG: hypothetical protein LBT46_10620 [Planctomycetaceae bacterium]|nr:hypothetical protein [Planctomycetaceae bacterium]